MNNQRIENHEKYIYLIVFVICMACCFNIRRSPKISFPCQWPGSPGFAPAANIDQQKFVEPSGICYHPLRKTLFVVSDEGEIAEIKVDGTPLFNVKIRGDLEDITVDPNTGLLYVVVEGSDIILEFNPEKKEVARRFPINREFQGNPNFLQKQVNKYDNGIESLVFIPDPDHPEGGTFYAGNQDDPACIMEILVPLKSSHAMKAEAKILRVVSFEINDPAAMYYDSKSNRMNVVSDADNLLVEMTLNGKIVKQYAFSGNDQEGLCRDEAGFIYIAQDSGGILKIKDIRKN